MTSNDKDSSSDAHLKIVRDSEIERRPSSGNQNASTKVDTVDDKHKQRKFLNSSSQIGPKDSTAEPAIITATSEDL